MAFNKTLNTNELYESLANMIINQEVFSDNIGNVNNSLLNAAMEDVGQYGDTVLRYYTDILQTNDWMGIEESANLLDTDLGPDPVCQSFTINKMKQIRLTTLPFLSKRAFATEGAYSQFNDVMKQSIIDTKNVSLNAEYNAFIGTVSSGGEIHPDTGKTFGKKVLCSLSAEVPDALAIAKTVADIITELTEPSRDYNDLGFMRSYRKQDIVIIWNSTWVNRLSKEQLPIIFHNDVFDDLTKFVLPGKYFGDVLGSGAGGGGGVSKNGDRALIEKTFTDADNPETKKYHLLAGELIPANCDYSAYEAYQPNDLYVCKIFVKLPPVYTSLGEMGSFYNPRSLSTNYYYSYAYNSEFKTLLGYPCITVTTD